jgi:hydrogenase expression/formation protein HypD
MEVCGTHTMALFETGVRAVMPENVELISGPGCPVCVTTDGYIDAAIELAAKNNVTLATFGDMVRVPGLHGSLESLRSRGARVVIVYSPLTAVDMARRSPREEVVFLAVGFETTVPAVARAVDIAAQEKIENFSILSAHKTIPTALSALLKGKTPLDGLLCPGHVSAVIGSDAYEPIVRAHHVPCVVSGFEASDMLRALTMLVQQVIAGVPRVENAYVRAVQPEGNPRAQELIRQVFQPCDADWRGLGTIPGSGLELRDSYRKFDARVRFGVSIHESKPRAGCRCGEILKGEARPVDCPLFGRACTPESPCGPCMVSSEGTCAAYYKYGEFRTRSEEKSL